MKKKVLFYILLLVCSHSNGQVDALLKQAEATNNFNQAKNIYVQVIEEVKEDVNIQDSVVYLFARKSIQLGKLDTALLITNYQINLTHTNKRNKYLSSYYNLKAAIFHHQLLLDSAIFYYLESIRIDENDKKDLKVAYTKVNMANVLLAQHNWEDASVYFSEALTTIRTYNDSAYLAGVIISLSTTYFDLKRFEESKELADEAIQIATTRKDNMGLLLAYRQQGHLLNQEKEFDKALFMYTNAYELALQLPFPYYKSITAMDLSNVYYEIKDYNKAIKFGELAINKGENFNTQLSTIYRVLAQAYEKVGNYRQAYLSMKQANDIREKISNETNQKIVNDLKEKYESAKKDIVIAEASLLLEKEKEKRTMFALMTIIALLAAIVLLLSMLFKRQSYKSIVKNLEYKKQQEIADSLIRGENNERKRISHDLHDGISNLLFNLKLSISSKDILTRKEIDMFVEHVNQIQKETRIIAHNLMPIDFSQTSFYNTVNNYIQAMNLNLAFQIQLHGYEKEQTQLPNNSQLVLFRTTQEFISNAIKYAQATEIIVQVIQSNKVLKIQIEDNGVGFNIEKVLHKGQGIASILERVKMLGAEIVFESKPNKGTFIDITLEE